MNNNIRKKIVGKHWNGFPFLSSEKVKFDHHESIGRKSRREIHMFFINERYNNTYGKYYNLKYEHDEKGKFKIVLLDIEKSENKRIKKNIHNSLIGGILLSSMSICLIEFDVITSMYGYLLCTGLLAFYTSYLYFYNSVILRAVLDYKNKHLLLYPFTIFRMNEGGEDEEKKKILPHEKKKKNIFQKKQIILSLHEIEQVCKDRKYIKIYLKKKNLFSLLFKYNMILPFFIPRYKCSETNKPMNNTDVLYPYDFNNFNISAFCYNKKHGKDESVSSIPRVKKNVDGYPQDAMEEAKLLSLLRMEESLVK
ncbi:conserved Plasmodium protein, unknown function [Plasmodium gonderi]|uniref:Uncharacterized protein n=1 Tax=Plasmodium gonderi TaxID=77519 RepID=A0A1Y1JD07_PLAGO|nr:conserved Plasmodium protein, unknown function [Plasmodium gonderi]GAW80399.1 conserved Plasmodium protein, unknown function [Plasmodium gonderi]